MADFFRPENVINGTFGEAWIGGDYMAEMMELKVDVDFNFDDVKMPRKLGTYKKMIGYEGKGEAKFYHITSRLTSLMAENLKNGKQTEMSIISKLADPDAFGHERILIKDAVFENIPLIEWEAAKIGEKSVSFSFTEFEFLDEIA